MLTPSIGLLLDAVDRLGLGSAGRFEDGGRDVDHVVELVADLAAAPGCRSGQWTIVPLRVPPQCEATCLVHWYGVSIACAQPTA